MSTSFTPTRPQHGFSLVEMAIVLLIIGLLVGGMLMPLSAQIETGKIKKTRVLLEDVQEALYGYAMVNGCLPCPAIANAAVANAGRENRGGGGCATACTGNLYHGFVPVVTLGLSGTLNEDNLLLDAWGNPLRYSVAQSFSSPAITSGTVADLVVCNNESASDTACNVADITLADKSPAVVFSMGRNGNDATVWSAEELENVEGTSQTGTTSGTLYPVPFEVDKVFVKQEYGIVFDDIMVWLSANILFNRLCLAGTLC